MAYIEAVIDTTEETQEYSMADAIEEGSGILFMDEVDQYYLTTNFSLNNKGVYGMIRLDDMEFFPRGASYIDDKKFTKLRDGVTVKVTVTQE